MKRKESNRNGVATIVAVALVGIAGMAGTAVMGAIAADCRRAQQAKDDAQIRQLLLVGAMSVREKSAGWDAPPKALEWSIPIPPELTGSSDGARQLLVKIADHPGAQLIANVKATLGHRHGAEEVRLERVAEKWRIASVSLLP